MSTSEQPQYVPARQLKTPYPLIDSDPYFTRVFKYARTRDYLEGLAAGAFAPALMLAWEKWSPSYASKATFNSIMRLSGVVGLGAAILTTYQSSCMRFYGASENAREVEMDMREMVDKVKKGEPLYGVSTLTPYMQGVASRNSRYSGFYLHVVPWFNFVNHDQHGVDTAKYYQQAERELEAERLAKGY